jgi:predicted flap endonuclease-1-like 5' DNA nuclease
MFELNPLDRSTAILEIIILLLVAAIIGFVTAWLYYRSIYRRKIATLEDEFAAYRASHVPKEDLERTEKALEEMSAARSQLWVELTNARQKITTLEGDLKTAHSERDQARKENLTLSGELAQKNTALLDCQTKLKALEVQVAALLAEAEKLQELSKQCESGLKKADTVIAKLKDELAVCRASQSGGVLPDAPAKKPAKKPAKVSDKKQADLDKVRSHRGTINFARIGEAGEADRDNLKVIKGIGPFIEEKLNALGIYTFAQIANFIDEDVEAVTKAIAFFPGRIQRDDWMKQASELKGK